MKGMLFILIVFYLSITISAQENFNWQKIDSLEKTKEQIYSDTKMFIASTWKNPDEVIKLDDQDAGVILLRGSLMKKVDHSLNEWTFIYSYTVTFKMKEGRYNFTIDNVKCTKAYPRAGTHYVVAPLQAYDVYSDMYKDVQNERRELTLPDKKAYPIINELKSELNLVFNKYIEFIHTESTLEDDW